jgi:hypothetical protein
MGEFDGLDDELFSERLDFRPSPSIPGGTPPEPTTVRLEERAPVGVPSFDLNADGPYAPHLATAPTDRPYAPDLAASPTYGPYAFDDSALGAGLDARDEDRDPILLVALAGLLLLVLISTGVVLWWFA